MNTRNKACVEKLEPRTLLSAWSTVDSLASGNNGVAGMTADALGNVYAIGDIVNSGGQTLYVIREKASGSTSWTTIANIGTSVAWSTNLAADPNGNIFFSGRVASSTNHWSTWELPHGSNTRVQIDDAGVVGYPDAEATDAAGNLYVAGDFVVPTKGNTSTDEWAVRKGNFNSSTGKWTFSTVDQTTSARVANGIGVVTTTINAVSSTSVYAVGWGGTYAYNSTWIVRKSTNGGPWAQVDSFRYDSTANATSTANGVTADAAGNVYVAGDASKALIIGHNKNGSPIYSYDDHWIVRKSGDGGASWSISDDYLYVGSPASAAAFAIGRDPSGNIYAVGQGDAGAGVHGIVRTNAGGSWATVDDYTTTAQAEYNAFAADSSGNHFAGGLDSGWVIRSDAPVSTSPTATTATAAEVFSSTQITSTTDPTDIFHHRKHR